MLKRALGEALRQFKDVEPGELLKQRRQRILAYGKVKEVGR
jgi:acetyl-CoA carboxylase carboxyl transferase subunit alpha